MMLLRYSLVGTTNHGPGAMDDVAKVLKAAHEEEVLMHCITRV